MGKVTRAVWAAIICIAFGGAALAEPDVERGEYLFNAVAACGNCHTPQGPEGPIPGKELAGGLVIEDRAFTVHTPNITPAAIGDWSDAELARAIREGVRPDGSLIRPPMPFEWYRHISDRDLADMIAYLRTVPPVEPEPLPESEYRIPLPPSYGPPVGAVAEVAEGNTEEYGAYLAGPLAHCLDCHTPFVKGHLDIENQLGAGGRDFTGPWGVSVSANLTAGVNALLRWSDDEVVAMIRTGTRPDGSRMAPPMAYHLYAGMSDRDAHAIVKYLRTLPPK